MPPPVSIAPVAVSGQGTGDSDSLLILDELVRRRVPADSIYHVLHLNHPGRGSGVLRLTAQVGEVAPRSKLSEFLRYGVVVQSEYDADRALSLFDTAVAEIRDDVRLQRLLAPYLDSLRPLAAAGIPTVQAQAINDSYARAPAPNLYNLNTNAVPFRRPNPLLAQSDTEEVVESFITFVNSDVVRTTPVQELNGLSLLPWDNGKPIRRIMVINRGEASVRFLSTIKKLNETLPANQRVTVISLYTDPDKDALFVRETLAANGEVVYLGKPTFVDPNDNIEYDRNGDVVMVGGEPKKKQKSIYLNQELMMNLAQHHNADSVWLGWGFLAEDAVFVAKAEAEGLRVIGPGSYPMHQLGDKIIAKQLVEAAGVPIAAWSGDKVDTVDEAIRAIHHLHYLPVKRGELSNLGNEVFGIKVDGGRSFIAANREELTTIYDRLQAAHPGKRILIGKPNYLEPENKLESDGYIQALLSPGHNFALGLRLPGALGLKIESASKGEWLYQAVEQFNELRADARQDGVKALQTVLTVMKESGGRFNLTTLNRALASKGPEVASVKDRYFTRSQRHHLIYQIVATALTQSNPAAALEVAIQELDGLVKHSKPVPVVLLDLEQNNFPVVVKARAGGGGKGIRFVRSEADLRAQWQGVRNEALKAFGNGEVFLEKAVSNARHIEVQVWADKYGNVMVVGDRDCTLQASNQKLLEMAPAPFISDSVRSTLHKAAVAAVKAAKLDNVSTVEFLVVEDYVSFMEVNTRLQVEHRITELVTGIDLVMAMIQSSLGKPLPTTATPQNMGYAIQGRVNAQYVDYQGNFTPSAGKVLKFQASRLQGVYTDTGISSNYEVTSDFDSMLAKVIGTGASFEAAVASLRGGLSDTVLVGDGLRSTMDILQELLENLDLLQGKIHTRWLEADYLPNRKIQDAKPLGHVALLLAAALHRRENDRRVRHETLKLFTHWTPAQLPELASPEVQFGLFGSEFELTTHSLAPDVYAIEIDGAEHRVELTQIDRRGFQYQASIDGVAYTIVGSAQATGYDLTINGSLYPIEKLEKGFIVSTMNGVVNELLLKMGEAVDLGAVAALVEAMKQTFKEVAKAFGVVVDVLVNVGDKVRPGTKLFRLEQPEEATVAHDDGKEKYQVKFPFNPHAIPATVADAQAVLDALVANRGRRLEAPIGIPEYRASDFAALMDIDHAIYAPQLFEKVRSGLLGYYPIDKDSDELALALTYVRILEELQLRAENPETLRLYTEHWADLLANYYYVEALFQEHFLIPGANRQIRAKKSPSYRDQFEDLYLRSPASLGQGTTEDFKTVLKGALAEYGVASLDYDPSDRYLPVALHRILRSHERVDSKNRLVAATFEALSRLTSAGVINPDTPNLVATVDNITHLDRDGSARGAIFAAHAYYYKLESKVMADLQPDKHGRVQLDGIYQTFLESSVRPSDATRRAAGDLFHLLYPHSRNASSWVPFFDSASTISEYYGYTGRFLDERGRDRRTVAIAYGNRTSLTTTLSGAVQQFRRDVHPEKIVELVLRERAAWSNDEEALDRIAGQIRDEIGYQDPGLKLARINVTLLTDNGQRQYLSFVPNPAAGDSGTYVEDRFTRGIHPSLTEAFEWWRLAKHQYRRLPSVDNDIVLVEATALGAEYGPENSGLIAYALAEDPRPQIDLSTRITRVPEIELQFRGAVAAIMLGQLRSDKPLNGNRIVVYVPDEVLLSREKITAIVQRLAPMSRGLGLAATYIRMRQWKETAEAAPREIEIRANIRMGKGLDIQFRDSKFNNEGLMNPVTPEFRRVAKLARNNIPYVYNYVQELTKDQGFGVGAFQEMDLADSELPATFRGSDITIRAQELQLQEVTRSPNANKSGVVVGVVTVKSEKYPEGMKRVVILNDASKKLASLAEPICSRVIAALNYARAHNLPVDWLSISSGAHIGMNSGVENLDWTAGVFGQLTKFTQDGGVINMVNPFVAVGAQAYWTAMSTMMMHNKGVLIMTAAGTNMLTGNEALGISGSPAARSNLDLGGYKSVYGPNGEAHYYAENIDGALRILNDWYELNYVEPGHWFPRLAKSQDPIDRKLVDPPMSVSLPAAYAMLNQLFLENGDEPKTADLQGLGEGKVWAAIRSKLGAEPPTSWRLLIDRVVNQLNTYNEQVAATQRTQAGRTRRPVGLPKLVLLDRAQILQHLIAQGVPPVELGQYSDPTTGKWVDLSKVLIDKTRMVAYPMRALMNAVANHDAPRREPWEDFEDAEVAITWDTEISGLDGTGEYIGSPVTLIGIDAQSLARKRPATKGIGPEIWPGGTLTPNASKKVARAINAASGRKPVVVLANLAGFDGTQESLQNLQLELGAEIGRAVTNFEGPIVFVVVTRYHGGAYVVFSKALNTDLQVFALNDTYASVIGGQVAVKVVNEPKTEVTKEAKRLEGEAEWAARLRGAKDAEATAKIKREIYAVAERTIRNRYDAIHTVDRAKSVGAIDDIIAADGLRQTIIEAVEAGKQTYVARKRGELAVNFVKSGMAFFDHVVAGAVATVASAVDGIRQQVLEQAARLAAQMEQAALSLGTHPVAMGARLAGGDGAAYQSLVGAVRDMVDGGQAFDPGLPDSVRMPAANVPAVNNSIRFDPQFVAAMGEQMDNVPPLLRRTLYNYYGPNPLRHGVDGLLTFLRPNLPAATFTGVADHLRATGEAPHSDRALEGGR